MAVLIGVFSVEIYFYSSNSSSQIQFKEQITIKEVRNISLSPSSEIPSVHPFEVQAMLDDKVLKTSVYNQSIIANGQGLSYFEYKVSADDKKELLQLYVHNRGLKDLNLRLRSPLDNKWIEASIPPGTIYGGEMQWGFEQEGNWYIDLNNADGSVITTDIAIIR